MKPQPHILQWNLNGIKTRLRLGEIQRVLNDHEPMCICLQHLGQYDTNLKNYQLVSQSIKTNDELGTAIYVHKEATYESIQVQNAVLQHSITQIYLGNRRKITILNIYNQPIYNYNITHLRNILTTLPQPILLVGDFNAHSPMWDENCAEPDGPGRKVEELMDECSLYCLNEEDTHTYVSNTNGAISSIDLALCSDTVANQFEWRALEDSYTSDHHPILITHLQQQNPVKEKRYKTDKADWIKYKAKLTTNLPEFDDQLNTEEVYKILKERIIEAADESIPLSGQGRKREVPWWSNELKELLKQKHKMSNLMIRTKKRLNKLLTNNHHDQDQMMKIIQLSTELKIIRPHLNKLTAKFKRRAILGRKESWEKYVSSINSRTPIKKIWRRFRKVSGSCPSPIKHALNVNGQRVHETIDICNAIAEKLENTSSNEFYDEQFLRYKNEQESRTITFTKNELNREYYNEPLTMEELMNALENTKNTAPGKDKINFEMLKNLPLNAKEYLLKLFNHIWETNTVPSEWMEAIIVPIPKPGKDPSNPGNYRPIALTSCVCKTMEKIVNSRLTTVLKHKKIISPIQTGAEKGKSTLEPLVNIEEHIRHSFRDKKVTIAIFFDIERAYDCTWKYQILKTMENAGINGQLAMFIQNFLNERSFQVKIEDELSNKHTQINGIAQGSVLSCTLFKIAIESIIKDLPRNIRKSLFMDDFCLYVSARRLRQAERILNIALRKLNSWSKKTGFKFSRDKTKAIIFYKDKRWMKNHEIQLKLGDNVIPVVDQHKFLGIILDKHLNFKAHVEYARSKCKKALNLVKKLSNSKWGADRKTLKLIYKATVIAILDYGCEVYGSATPPTLKRLEPIHNEGLRLITGAFRSSPAASLQVESGEPPLTLHREEAVMKSKIRLLHNNSTLNQLFNQRDIYWKIDGREDTAPFPTRANRLLAEADIDPIAPPKVDLPPAWQRERAQMCFALIDIEKNQNIPQVNKQKSLSHINRKPRHFGIFTDGSKSEAGVGCAAVCTLETRSAALPKHATICTAELWAIKLAQEIVENTQFINYTIYSDSKSALEAIKKYEPQNHIAAEITKTIHTLRTLRAKLVSFCWIPAHVGIPGNEYADAAAKEAIAKEPTQATIPPRDYTANIKRSIIEKWQRIWDGTNDENKLKKIKQEVKEWSTSNNESRETEVVMTRLRIGHTHLTHGHLMTTPHDPPATCERCGAHQSVKHILIDCPRMRTIRNRYFGNKELKDILGNGPTSSTAQVIAYLKEVELINKI